MASEIIDWEEAMEQCGEDEEFLRELLEDLKTETETQLHSIGNVIQVSIVIGQVRVGPLIAPPLFYFEICSSHLQLYFSDRTPKTHPSTL